MEHHRSSGALQFGTVPYEGHTDDMMNNTVRGLSHEDVNVKEQSSMNQPAANCVQTASTSPDAYWTSPESAPVHEMDNDFANDFDSGSILAVAEENYSLLNNDDNLESQAVIEGIFAPSGSIDCVERLSDPMQVTHVERQIVPWNGSLPLPPEASGVEEELNQVNSKRKRENAPNKDEKGKRCNCKNSKCLKLYCECFTSGVYCLDSCGCQNCQNRPDYEDTVLIKRSEIESRNPLAFVPKVTNECAGSPANAMEVGAQMTPSSARHRRGCNCKNSKCSKRYCECFQGNVGCSINCRCEDCQNVFGRKTDKMYSSEPCNGIMILMSKTEYKNSGNGIANQFPSLEGHDDMNHYGPSSQSSIMASPQWYPVSQVQPLAMSWPVSNHSPGGLSSSLLLENRVSLDRYGTVQDMMAGGEIMPEETSPPSKAVQASSPKQNHVPVAARFGVDRLSLDASSHQGSTFDCKPLSTTFPSSSTFAAISPPADGVYQTGGDPKSLYRSLNSKLSLISTQELSKRRC